MRLRIEHNGLWFVIDDEGGDDGGPCVIDAFAAREDAEYFVQLNSPPSAPNVVFLDHYREDAREQEV